MIEKIYKHKKFITNFLFAIEAIVVVAIIMQVNIGGIRPEIFFWDICTPIIIIVLIILEIIGFIVKKSR
jgi:hypothetical protein